MLYKKIQFFWEKCTFVVVNCSQVLRHFLLVYDFAEPVVANDDRSHAGQLRHAVLVETVFGNLLTAAGIVILQSLHYFFCTKIFLKCILSVSVISLHVVIYVYTLPGD